MTRLIRLMPHSLLRSVADFDRILHDKAHFRSHEGTLFEGSTLIPEDSSLFAEMLTRRFLGEVRCYRCAGRQIVIRTSGRGTRRLEPTEAALREEGYEIRDISLDQDQWRSYYASRLNERIHVREQVRELASNRTWHSLTTWFWHATLFPQAGPWESITVVTPLQKK